LRVRLDLPIFSSPTAAWGNASGDIEIAALPSNGAWLDLPMRSTELAQLGMPARMLVWSSVPHDDGSTTVLLDGVVAANPEEAARIGQILEEEFKFFVDEYDHTPIPSEELHDTLIALGASGHGPTSDAWLSIYGRLRGSTVLAVNSLGEHLSIEVDDQWPTRPEEVPPQPGILVFLSPSHTAAELGWLVGKQLGEAHFPEINDLVLGVVDHDDVRISASYVAWVNRDWIRG